MRWFCVVWTSVLLASSVPGSAQSVPVVDAARAEPLKPQSLLKNVLQDQRAIWTSPFHISRANAAEWLVPIAATGALIAADRSIVRQLPNTLDQVAYSLHMSDAGVYAIASVTGGLYVIGKLAKNTKAQQTGLMAAEALADGELVGEALKLAFRRERPTEGDGKGKFWSGGTSFPSGHSIESFALASVIAHQYHDHKAVQIAAYGFAALVSASRLSARKHFPSDVVAGSTIGWFIGTHVFQVRSGLRTRARSALWPQITPAIQPANRVYAVGLTWRLRSESCR
jgi:membrane-associated phospholipid phosphatase